jgi:hypothetical protein
VEHRACGTWLSWTGRVPRTRHGLLAHLAERSPRTGEAPGSTPGRSTGGRRRVRFPARSLEKPALMRVRVAESLRRPCPVPQGRGLRHGEVAQLEEHPACNRAVRDSSSLFSTWRAGARHVPSGPLVLGGHGAEAATGMIRRDSKRPDRNNSPLHGIWRRGSALGLGPSGRQLETGYPDQSPGACAAPEAPRAGEMSPGRHAAGRAA